MEEPKVVSHFTEGCGANWAGFAQSYKLSLEWISHTFYSSVAQQKAESLEKTDKGSSAHPILSYLILSAAELKLLHKTVNMMPH